jgi:hypothetical protein
MDHLANQLEEAFNNIGASMMSTEFAAKLLAWTLKYGGGNEAVTMHSGLNAGIRIAQTKFNLFGGEIPTLEDVQAFNKYHNELEAETEDLTCEWLWEIYLRYDLDTSSLKSKCPEHLKETRQNLKPEKKTK